MAPISTVFVTKDGERVRINESDLPAWKKSGWKLVEPVKGDDKPK